MIKVCSPILVENILAETLNNALFILFALFPVIGSLDLERE